MESLNSNRNAILFSIGASLFYAVSSMSMTISNKMLVSPQTYNFQYSIALTLYQNIFALFLLFSAGQMGYVNLEWKWEIAKRWIPVNVVFLSMLVTGQISLFYLSVAMVTVFKNLATIGTTIGDFVFQGNPITPLIAASLITMLLGSIAAGFFDLEFSLQGYIWMGLNCVSTSSYVLLSKAVLKDTSATDGSLYNNTISIPILLVWLFIQNNTAQIMSHEAWSYTGFYVWLFVSGICGTCMSLATFCALKVTSPTTYAVVGSLNKIPLTIIGTVLFRSIITVQGWVSIVIGLGGGVLYSYAKVLQNRQKMLEQTKVVVVQEEKKQEALISI